MWDEIYMSGRWKKKLFWMKESVVNPRRGGEYWLDAASTCRLGGPDMTRKAKSELFSAFSKLPHLASWMYHRLEENEAKRGNDPAYCCLRGVKFESATCLQLPLLLLLLFILTAIIQKIIICVLKPTKAQLNSTRHRRHLEARTFQAHKACLGKLRGIILALLNGCGSLQPWM